MTLRVTLSAVLLLLTARLVLAPARGEEQAAPIEVRIKDHRFVPSEIHFPAGKPGVLLVGNEDESAEEVESGPLAIEKMIPAGAQSRIRLHPLSPGRYKFMGEFHPETAQGVIVVE